MGAMGLDSTLNIAHQACAKYSTLNKIAHVNCAKTGDMEIAHVNVLEIAHPFFPVYRFLQLELLLFDVLLKSWSNIVICFRICTKKIALYICYITSKIVGMHALCD